MLFFVNQVNLLLCHSQYWVNLCCLLSWSEVWVESNQLPSHPQLELGWVVGWVGLGKNCIMQGGGVSWSQTFSSYFFCSWVEIRLHTKNHCVWWCGAWCGPTIYFSLPTQVVIELGFDKKLVLSSSCHSFPDWNLACFQDYWNKNFFS